MSMDIDLDFDWIRDVVDDAYTMGVGAAWVVSEFTKRGYAIVPTTVTLEEQGFSIVPTASVPTPEQRAAVGRLVDLAVAETAYYGDAPLSGFDHVAAVRSTKAALQPGDIEAARAVANYPENPECSVAEGGE